MDCSGYNDIQSPRQRKSLIDFDMLKKILNIPDSKKLQTIHRSLIEEYLASDNRKRESKWIQSIAVGSNEFVEQTREKLGMRAKGRKVIHVDKAYELREVQAAYNDDFEGKMGTLRPKNAYFWNIYPVISAS